MFLTMKNLKEHTWGIYAEILSKETFYFCVHFQSSLLDVAMTWHYLSWQAKKTFIFVFILLSVTTLVTRRVSGHFNLKFFQLTSVWQFLNNFFNIFNEQIAIAINAAIHATICVYAIVPAKFANSVVMQKSDRCRHIHVDSFRIFPNKMVPRLFDVSWDANIFRSLFLRIEFFFSASFSQDSECRPISWFFVVRKLEVEKWILKRIWN